jgi:hypothetical protein
MPDESMRLVGAVLAGERGNIDRCVGSLRSLGVAVELFDTTESQRHAGLVRDGVRLTPLKWAGSFADARNSALDVMRTHDPARTVLWVDSDERLLKRPDERTLRQIRNHGSGPLVLCPSIRDSRHEVKGVGRLHSLRAPLRFVGRVHEYLTSTSETPAEYGSCDVAIEHSGYDDWDRTSRNDQLLRGQLAVDSDNPRWRPFWVRDAGAVLTAHEIGRAIREFAALGRFDEAIGGIAPADYTRMIAWHGAWHLITTGNAAMVDPALRRLPLHDDDDALSEVLYLRLVSNVMSCRPVEDVLVDAFSCRRRSLRLGAEQPWLDAGISIALDADGRHAEASAYRADSSSFTDPFCVDSELRMEYRTARTFLKS